jgi:hypothetical protein
MQARARFFFYPIALWGSIFQNLPFRARRTHVFLKKMKKNLHMSQNLRNFVRFLARKPAKAEKNTHEQSKIKNIKSKIFYHGRQ